MLILIAKHNANFSRNSHDSIVDRVSRASPQARTFADDWPLSDTDHLQQPNFHLLRNWCN